MPRSPRHQRPHRHRFPREMFLVLESRVLMDAALVDTDIGQNELPAVFDSGVPSDGAAASGVTGFVSSGPEAISALQQYHSRPSAVAKIYLNFVGAPAQQWGSYSAPAQSAYSTDSDTTTFSDAEQSQIYEVWARVAEKFSPFDVDVTTQDPGNRNAYQTVAVDFASDNGSSWIGGAWGGIAYVGSFASGWANDTVYVFPANLGPYVPKYMAEAASHEVGHSFGLQHQSTFADGVKSAEYNTGTAATAPMMGDPYGAVRGMWWDGSNTFDVTQDDMSIIATSNHFGYRADDHPDSLSGGDPLAVSGTSVSGSGVIEQTTDADVFTFHTGAGPVQLIGNSAAYGAMLDFKLQLFDSNGTLLASSNNDTFTESITTTLATGDYRLVVSSNGAYGDVGQYTISGTLSAAPAPATPASVAVSGVTTTQATLTWASVPGATSYRIERSQDGINFTTLAVVSNGVTLTDSGLTPGGTYDYRVSAMNDGGVSVPSAVVQAVTLAAGLAAPNSLTVTALVDGRVVATWVNPNSTAQMVSLEMSTDGTNYISYASMGAGVTGYVTAALTPLRTYWFRVRVYNTDATSDYSAVVRITIQDASLLAAGSLPIGIDTTINNDTPVKLVTSTTIATDTPRHRVIPRLPVRSISHRPRHPRR